MPRHVFVRRRDQQLLRAHLGQSFNFFRKFHMQSEAESINSRKAKRITLLSLAESLLYPYSS